MALSRVTSLGNLFIRNLNETKININKDVKAEMDRLTSDMKVTSAFSAYFQTASSCFRVLFQNVLSLHKHFFDIKPDRKYLCTDVNIFVETKLTASDSDDYNLQGVHHYRFDWPSCGRSRTPFGIIVYSKAAILESSFYHKTYTTAAGTAIEAIAFDVETNLHHCPKVKVAALYSSPKATVKELEKFLVEIKEYILVSQATPVIVMGDFNIDYIAKPNYKISAAFSPVCATGHYRYRHFT